MDMLLIGGLVLVLLCALVAGRNVRAAAWTRELERAFGEAPREIPRHRTL